MVRPAQRVGRIPDEVPSLENTTIERRGRKGRKVSPPRRRLLGTRSIKRSRTHSGRASLTILLDRRAGPPSSPLSTRQQPDDTGQ